MMKTKRSGLTVMIFTVIVFVFTSLLIAQNEDDFISISPVEKKDTGTMMEENTIKVEPVKKAETQPAVAPEKVSIPSERLASVEKITYLDSKDKLEIRIITSDDVKYKATELEPPPNDRILIQIFKCKVDYKSIDVNKAGVNKIRSAPHNSTAWVVVDLSSKQRWKIRNETKSIVLEILKTSETRKEDALVSKPAPSSMIYRVLDVAAKNLGKQTRIIITTDGPIKYRIKKDAENKILTVNILNAVSAWKEGSINRQIGNVASIDLKENKQTKVIDINIKFLENLPYTVVRDQNQILIDIDNVLQTGQLPKKKLDLNQRLSINVQDASLPSVLRLLSAQTGFEFSISPSVSTAASVTIREEDRPLYQILRDVLIPRQLYYEIQNNIIKVGSVSELKSAKALRPKLTKFYYPKTMLADNLKKLLDVQIGKEPLMDLSVTVDNAGGMNRIMLVGTEEDVEQVMDMIASIDYSKDGGDYEGSEGGILRTKIFKLKNIRLQEEAGNAIETQQVTELKDTIEALLTKQGDVKGTLTFDRRTSSLIVTDTPAVLKRVQKVLDTLDVKVPQVTIEAKLYEVSVDAANDIGINWTAIGQDKEPYIKGDINVGAVPSVGSVGQFVLGTIQNGFKIDAYLKALERNNKASLLSAPKVTVQTNMPATIKTSRQVYYEESSIVTQTSGPPVVTTEFKSVELPISLNVICKVDNQDTINMVVHVEVQSLIQTNRTSGPPDITKQNADTYVKAKNNETIVIGGLLTDKVTETENKVPLLGDIPLLGNLFRATSKTNEKTELIVFLTPSIVED
ncbi:MAG TPA: secretin N-terminal domain-containing protein [Candidatus Goldiibacteriota bacterium]|nr:secretin N-terminal domain-containing protein [Candidatus Goldiibacteriota bacterium]